MIRQILFHGLWILTLVFFSVLKISGGSTTHAGEMVGIQINLESLSFVPGGPLLAGSGTHSLSERIVLKGISLPASRGVIYFWSTENGRLDDFVPFSKEVLPKHFDISQDGARMVVIFSDYTQKEKKSFWLGCYSLMEKRWLWKSRWGSEDNEPPDAVKFLPSGRSILTLGYFSVWYYDAETGHRIDERKGVLKEYPVYRWALRSRYVSPSGRYLVIWQEKPYEGIAWGVNKFVTVWDLPASKEVARWRKPGYECQIATFSPDEQSVVFGCKDGYIREWSIKNQSLVRELKTSAEVLSVMFSPNGKYLAVNSGIKDITVFDYATLRKLHDSYSPGRNYPVPVGEQYPMVFSADGESMALWDRGRICLYSTANWEQKWCVVPTPPDLPKK